MKLHKPLCASVLAHGKHSVTSAYYFFMRVLGKTTSYELAHHLLKKNNRRKDPIHNGTIKNNIFWQHEVPM
jgi:hypothetical protein